MFKLFRAENENTLPEGEREPKRKAQEKTSIQCMKAPQVFHIESIRGDTVFCYIPY